MSLALTLDFALRQLNEPGYHKEITSRLVGNFGQPVAQGDWVALWAEPATQTLMLRPLQLNKDWLDSERQLGSVIRLADFTVEATDLSGKRVFEDAAFGNTSNPYIYHHASAPSTWWSPAPSMPGPPGAAPSLTGIPSAINNSGQDLVTVRPNNVYTPHLIVPDPVTPPTPTLIGGTSDGRYICETKAKFDPNQGFCIRWYQVASQVGFPMTYSFYLGSHCVNIKDVVVEVYQDVSAHGDRTSWKKVFTKPLFSVRDFSVTGLRSNFLAATNPTELLAHDRSLIWLPFRRNQVLLLASTGAYGMIQTNARPKRRADDSDWDITRSDTVVVWCLSPSPGRFQLQKIAYQTGAIKAEVPSVKLTYIPAATPTVTLYKDSDHGTTVTAAIATPPTNTITTSNAEDCLAVASAPSDQAKTYGLTLTLQGSSDGRWSPYFYRMNVDAPRTFVTPSTTPTSVLDLSSANSYIQDANIHAGQGPGDGRMTVHAIDKGTYPMSPFYYRHTIPVQLLSDGVAVFTGITEPNEVVPIKLTARPRFMTYSALDLWSLLVHTFFEEARDYTGTGHITAIKEVLEIAGYDTVTYPLDTLTINATNDTPLGLGSVATQSASKSDKTNKAGWEPNTGECAADFIQRIAEKFSNWMVGFHPNGQFFYHPKDHYTAVEAVFSPVHTGAAPYFYDATFRTIAPEANALTVFAAEDQSGQRRRSPTYIDYASLRNPAKVNYMGRVRKEIIEITGSYSCRELNYIARRMWDAARRRHLTVEFKGDYVAGLKVGRVIALDTYGTYRIQEFDADFISNRWKPVRYTAELVEAGF